MITKDYIVDRIVDRNKIILLDKDNEDVRVVVNSWDFISVKVGDIVQVTWTIEVGAFIYRYTEQG